MFTRIRVTIIILGALLCATAYRYAADRLRTFSSCNYSASLTAYVRGSGDTITHTFDIENTTHHTVTLQRESISCICLRHGLPEVVSIAPNSSAKLVMSVRTPSIGSVTDDCWQATYHLVERADSIVKLKVCGKLIPRLSTRQPNNAQSRVMTVGARDGYRCELAVTARVPFGEPLIIPSVVCVGLPAVSYSTKWGVWERADDGFLNQGVLSIEPGIKERIDNGEAIELVGLSFEIKQGDYDKLVVPVLLRPDIGIATKPRSLFFRADAEINHTREIIVSCNTKIAVLGVSSDSDLIHISLLGEQEAKHEHRFLVELMGDAKHSNSSVASSKLFVCIDIDHPLCKRLRIPVYIQTFQKRVTTLTQ